MTETLWPQRTLVVCRLDAVDSMLQPGLLWIASKLAHARVEKELGVVGVIGTPFSTSLFNRGKD